MRGRNYKFEAVYRPSEFAHELRDCTVRALSNVLGTPYAKAHAYLKAQGRNDRETFSCYGAYIGLGLRDFQLDGATARYRRLTVGQWLKSGKLPPRCIMRINGHVFAVVHGVVLDTYPVYSGSRVRHIFA